MPWYELIILQSLSSDPSQSSTNKASKDLKKWPFFRIFCISVFLYFCHIANWEGLAMPIWFFAWHITRTRYTKLYPNPLPRSKVIRIELKKGAIIKGKFSNTLPIFFLIALALRTNLDSKSRGGNNTRKSLDVYFQISSKTPPPNRLF